MIRKASPALIGAIFLVSLAVIGYWMLFSNLAIWDDEGYILISAREYFAHGGLYESVYSQYGPAFYVLTDAFQFLLGSPVDHTSARLLTLALWLGAAGCCAALVRKQTSSLCLTLFTLTAAFLYLNISNEPLHPGALIVFVLALSLYVTTELIGAGRLAGAAVVAGCTGAILVLTKINVGAFYVAGVGAWSLLNAAPGHRRRATELLVVGALVLLAVALMYALWHETWIQLYLALFAIGAATLVAALRPEVIVKLQHAGLGLAAGGGSAVLILGAVWLRGTSGGGLVNGVLLGPLRHPGSYSYAVDWRPGSLVLAGLSLLLALAHPWIRRRFSDEAADRLVVTLRLLQTAALLVGVALLMNYRVGGAIFSYVAPLIWIWVIPLKGAETSRPALAGRGLLAIVLLLQYLHAYPVGGSQESWGTFLFMPLVALGLGEIQRWFLARQPERLAPQRGWTVLVAVIMAVLVVKVAWTAVTLQQRYAPRSDLALPGAGSLRLPEAQRSAYELLTLNAVAHADLLFSLPGMFSFNLWTNLPTPTRKNTTLWFTLLDDEAQVAIIQSIAQSSRPCVIVQESLLLLMRGNNVPVRGILRDYLFGNFTPVFRVEGFAFLVRTGRSIAPLGLAQLTPAAAPGPGLTDTRLDLCLVNDGTPVTAIEICDLATPHSPTLTLNAANTQATVVAVNSADRPMGAPKKISWPLHCQGLARLSLLFNRRGAALPPATTVFYLQGPEGKILGTVRMSE